MKCTGPNAANTPKKRENILSNTRWFEGRVPCRQRSLVQAPLLLERLSNVCLFVVIFFFCLSPSCMYDQCTGAIACRDIYFFLFVCLFVCSCLRPCHEIVKQLKFRCYHRKLSAKRSISVAFESACSDTSLIFLLFLSYTCSSEG